ncbi:hypothetical protein OTK49_03405 [Vibrio coralliirubri]|uniref:hypothetical protein n=1 Tax=Vibrio coralliirubri TaxID=1516159 RepID=UPI002283D0E9|nr:hypothetical protein [Vibrio coralliirubri]MCY9861564.1 hypothetical protein [Vibrio coralliirubri]
MIDNIRNGEKVKLVYCTLPTFDFPEMPKIVIHEDAIAIKSGAKSFLANVDERDGAGGGIRVNHDEIGVITRIGCRIRLVIKQEDCLLKAITQINELVVTEYQKVLEKIDRKRQLTETKMKEAIAGLEVTVVKPHDFN